MQNLKTYILSLDFNSISEERKMIMMRLRNYIKTNNGDINLTFICTHNSRRSHFGQVWAMVAADYYGWANVKTFSGGTEATACNIRTIRALKRAGLKISSKDKKENPTYSVFYNVNKAPIEAFSKVFNAPVNPIGNFAVIMTCDSANDNCPFIPGTLVRIPILYIDPKVSDDTDKEIETYDARCRQIATEMFWVFKDLQKP
jgi:arsenate reductase